MIISFLLFAINFLSWLTQICRTDDFPYDFAVNLHVPLASPLLIKQSQYVLTYLQLSLLLPSWSSGWQVLGRVTALLCVVCRSYSCLNTCPRIPVVFVILELHLTPTSSPPTSSQHFHLMKVLNRSQLCHAVMLKKGKDIGLGCVNGEHIFS